MKTWQRFVLALAVGVAYLPSCFAQHRAGQARGQASQQRGGISAREFAGGPRAGQQGLGQHTPRSNGTSVQQGTIDLLRLWEEEKLARDVYTRLGESTGLNIFRNIARSEHLHMRWVQNMAMPGRSRTNEFVDVPGKFKDAEYQRLYETLVAEGILSPAAALTVGLKIEEMDIADIQRLVPQANEPRIQQTLQRLLRGSQSHLRSLRPNMRRTVAPTSQNSFYNQTLTG